MLFQQRNMRLFFSLRKIINENNHQGGSEVRVWAPRNTEDLIFKVKLTLSHTFNLV